MEYVVFCGNLASKGFFRNPEATHEALTGGWFHSSDLRERCLDGSKPLKDRSNDIIMSGSEDFVLPGRRDTLLSPSSRDCRPDGHAYCRIVPFGNRQSASFKRSNFAHLLQGLNN